MLAQPTPKGPPVSKSPSVSTIGIFPSRAGTGRSERSRKSGATGHRSMYDEDRPPECRVVTYPYDTHLAPQPLPPPPTGRQFDTRFIVEQTLRCNRITASSGIYRLLASKACKDLICDTYWWMFLRYFLMVDLLPLLDRHRDGSGPDPNMPPGFPTVASACRRDGTHPLHVYHTGFSAATRPSSAIHLSSGPCVRAGWSTNKTTWWPKVEMPTDQYR
eukprot:Hpha_TRINITY_DN10173_c0_g2::TRINITY_DN10173_c0_g2_i2::g.131776::m.131776